MTITLASRITRLENRIEPENDIAQSLQAAIDRQRQHCQWREKGQWQTLQADLRDNLLHRVDNAKAVYERFKDWPKKKLNQRQAFIITMAFDLLIYGIYQAEHCLRQQAYRFDGYRFGNGQNSHRETLMIPETQKQLIGEAIALVEKLKNP